MCRKPTTTSQHTSAGHPPVYFRLGKLRFGFHGVVGILSVLLTIVCLFIVEGENDPHLWLAIVANEIVALDAYSLLGQVPHSTVICERPKTVAPHKEAFKRTMAVMHYLNLRMSRPWLPVPVYAALLVFIWTKFLPSTTTDFGNLNTWYFVIPMFVGVSMDACCQWIFAEYLTTRYLLAIQLSALGLAFAFTLAFRGIVNIRPIYYGSAAIVESLVFGAMYFLAVSVSSS